MYQKYKSWPFEDYPKQTTPSMSNHMNHFNEGVKALDKKMQQIKYERTVVESLTEEEKAYAAAHDMLTFGCDAYGNYGYFVQGGKFIKFGGRT